MGQICGKLKKPAVQTKPGEWVEVTGTEEQERMTRIVNENVLNTFENTDTAEESNARESKESSNDDSVLFFGDGHPDIPSDKVTDLVTKYLDKVEEEDDNIDPSFTVVEKPDVADIANNVI